MRDAALAGSRTRKPTGTALVAFAALAALALAAAANAAYTTPTVTVWSSASGTTRIVASASVDDDATARVAIVIPFGAAITTSAAPGTKVGGAFAHMSALALGGALLRLAGDVVVAPPNEVDPATQAQCTQGVAPRLTLLLVLRGAGRAIDLPAYVIPTSGARAPLGPAQLVLCLRPPDLPADRGGAPLGAKLLVADVTVGGVLGPAARGAWVGFWTPWIPGAGTVDAAATVASPAAFEPGEITLTGRKVEGVRRLTGRVTQSGAGVVTRVAILAGRTRLAMVGTRQNGTFAYAVPKSSKAQLFRARAVAGSRSAPAVCDRFGALGVPCVNPTVSGFTATSRVVRLR